MERFQQELKMTGETLQTMEDIYDTKSAKILDDHFWSEVSEIKLSPPLAAAGWPAPSRSPMPLPLAICRLNDEGPSPNLLPWKSITAKFLKAYWLIGLRMKPILP
ncbi:hypothetical protein Pyn_15599 [Prunus yedoensis var. nudiflora]|uniref:Uncharacterized protein n=1 Tax=Prunus yedoensis var. nudiflora TaxID=2094558 RepID=A0A314Z068_PRUYE|nr:hypothetical protein Pyn_15599 [Prunus yedoensis var. nudiflora]